MKSIDEIKAEIENKRAELETEALALRTRRSKDAERLAAVKSELDSLPVAKTRRTRKTSEAPVANGADNAVAADFDGETTLAGQF